jgi:hypothetical protein
MSFMNLFFKIIIIQRTVSNSQKSSSYTYLLYEFPSYLDEMHFHFSEGMFLDAKWS